MTAFNTFKEHCFSLICRSNLFRSKITLIRITVFNRTFLFNYLFAFNYFFLCILKYPFFFRILFFICFLTVNLIFNTDFLLTKRTYKFIKRNIWENQRLTFLAKVLSFNSYHLYIINKKLRTIL